MGFMLLHSSSLETESVKVLFFNYTFYNVKVFERLQEHVLHLKL